MTTPAGEQAAVHEAGEATAPEVLIEWFLSRYHVDWLTDHLHAGTRPDAEWEPNAGERGQAEADAYTVLERLERAGFSIVRLRKPSQSASPSVLPPGATER